MSEDTTATESATGTVTESKTRSTGKRKAISADRVAASLTAVVAKRSGRKGKTRHDAEDVPIDGDIHEMLAIDPESMDPEFEYSWLSDGDLARFGGRGYLLEKWGPGCAQPKCYFGEKKRGETIRFRELTLAKLPKARAAAIRDKSSARQAHNARMRAIVGQAKQTGGAFSVTQQTVAFPGS